MPAPIIKPLRPPTFRQPSRERSLAYKNLMVVLDADQSSRERISYAAALAAGFEAHLVGLYLTVSSLTRDEYALLDIGILDISFFSDPAKSREETRSEER